ncbi:MAG: glycosyltransferase [Bacteroidales bacterium]|nr:glycosyltransferase [Bacteroidales bacterium]
MKDPTIIVVAYNRPKSLQRLLCSLKSAEYETKKVNLVISIDKSNNACILETAKKFNWEHGVKEIISHKEHLGLIKHVLSVLELSKKYEEIIVLEDDLVVSPYFYLYACEALKYFKKSEKIAGISLYGYSISESSLLTFTPVDNGSDVYFMQYPASWGFCMNHNQCNKFINALENKELELLKNDPYFVKQWPKHSWKRFFIRYLLKYDKYFVYPRLSLTTNFADKGRNTPVSLDIYQVPLQLQPKSYIFADIENNISIYDMYFEMLPEAFKKICPFLKHYSFEMDIQGVKDLSNVKLLYALSSKETKKRILCFNDSMNPLVNNIAFNIKGCDLNFSLISNLKSKPLPVHFGHAQFVVKYSKILRRSKFPFAKYTFYLWKYMFLMMLKKITG